MQIDDEMVSYLEDLSCLTLQQDEKSRLAGDLQQIFTGVSRLDELNTEGVPECSRPLNNVNVFREDEALPSFDRELILKNAPQRTQESILAPKTVE